MKMAKVNPVYEGKIRNTGEGREEDEEADRSRMARQDAKARRRNFRMSLRARPRYRLIQSNQTNIVTRSVASSSLDKENQDMNKAEDTEDKRQNQDVNKVKQKEKGKEKAQKVIIVEEEEKTEDEAAAAAVAAASGSAWPVGSGMFVGIDDWPMTWSYEEEWLWGGERLGLGLTNLHWEYISGVGWIEK